MWGVSIWLGGEKGWRRQMCTKVYNVIANHRASIFFYISEHFPNSVSSSSSSKLRFLQTGLKENCGVVIVLKTHYVQEI